MPLLGTMVTGSWPEGGGGGADWSLTVKTGWDLSLGELKEVAVYCFPLNEHKDSFTLPIQN